MAMLLRQAPRMLDFLGQNGRELIFGGAVSVYELLQPVGIVLLSVVDFM
jgi:hypothetical protein